MSAKKKMEHNPEETLQQTMATSLDKAEIQLCLGSLSQGDAPDIQRVQISKEVAEEFRNIAETTLARQRKKHSKQDLILKPYDPGTKLDDHEVEYLELDDSPAIGNQITGLNDPSTLDAFAEDEDFVAKLRFYVIVLSPEEGEPMLLFRTYTPKSELGQSTRFAIYSSKGTYDRFTAKLFLFDQYIDCMVRGGVLFVFNKDKFQKIFRFYELLLKSAQDTLKVIRERIPIDDFSGFAAACEGHLQKLAKLKNIASKPYLQEVTMKDIKKVIDRYKLPIITTGSGPDEKIKFDTSDKWAILRLLDDDYLESVMTGNSYEVNSKRSI